MVVLMVMGFAATSSWGRTRTRLHLPGDGGAGLLAGRDGHRWPIRSPTRSKTLQEVNHADKIRSYTKPG